MIQAKNQQISDLQAKSKGLQQRCFQSVAVQASYLAVASDFLRGVEICGEHTMEVVGDHLPQKLTWPGYGFNIEVSDGALSHGVTASIAVKAIVTGQFKFPENYQQISALYWISCSEVFLKHVAVNIQHCAHITTEEECTTNFSFILAKCSQENLPYTFIKREGVFNPHTQYATVKLKRFSIVGAVATEDTKKYFVALKFYKQIPNTHNMSFQFAVLPGINAFIEAFHADRKQKGWIEDDDDHQIIEFADSFITLVLPSEPINNWRIVPRSHPLIYKSEVDQPREKFHPCCTLEIRWVGGRQVTELFYKVRLEGAQAPRDYFTISLHPIYLAVARETSKREHQSSEFMKSLTSVIGDKMADVAKELEMSMNDNLLEQFYDNGGDDIELAQCLRAAESTTSSAPTAAPVPVVEGETQSGKEKFKSEPISVVLLVDAVKKVNDWHNLGLHLYLEETKLEEIGITYNGVGRIKAELFKAWLKSNPDASWDKLVAALNSIGEKSVAAEVESKYCKQLPGPHASTVSSATSASYAATSHHCLDRSSLRRVFSILTQYSDWKSLGLLLGLESATLEAIKADNSGKKQACKREMLENWLDGKDQVTECGGPTWQQLADCLKQLEDDSLAKDIEEQYCRD